MPCSLKKRDLSPEAKKVFDEMFDRLCEQVGEAVSWSCRISCLSVLTEPGTKHRKRDFLF